jgi:hypothetical protein
MEPTIIFSNCGKAVLVDPIKPTVKVPVSLKLNHYELLSNVAFNFYLRRYIADIRKMPTR